MELNFYKYQGTGNDFIIIDSRQKQDKIGNSFLFKKLCDRHFGVGADGIILIQNDDENDESHFYMKYCNSDGKESTMCGNGGRCAISFAANRLGINKIHFRAVDGYHDGFIIDNLVSINMLNIDKKTIEIHPKYVFINTGSPHHVQFVENIKEKNVYKEGKKIRFQKDYCEKGVNVNFVKILENNMLQVRTYERGVEDETLSCGTGVVASVIAACETNKIKNHVEKILVQTLGGKLWVSLTKTKNEYQNVYLTGNVKFIFKGYILI
ncbi:diaminopimelate epimerase [Blattabacterium sp. (Blaberus giganteus)]|uniref:diaminopimelate epimerase n=1 Tax=Blattabacterium sp. (Blaberus giganteus) TaxID=1186051 RepID=UPI00025F6EF1|nr:diaminopimelate epimerase [Blattabacterium sp. (Blaberus giganteus)]AFJ90687.1 diaminopimelate epimerase [Blattabacterium sp. (Blaberus giganteus)]